MSAKPSLPNYSDVALKMALEQLQRSGQWPERRQQLEAELQRRNRIRRGREAA